MRISDSQFKDPRKSMELYELVRGRYVVPQLKAKSKTEAIHELWNVLVEDQAIPDHKQQTVLDAVIKREELPTGLGNGLSLPHGVADIPGRELAVLGIGQRGYCFRASDGLLCHVVILLITPETYRYRHSQNVCKIANLAASNDFCEALLACQSQGDILSYLKDLMPDGHEPDLSA